MASRYAPQPDLELNKRTAPASIRKKSPLRSTINLARSRFLRMSLPILARLPSHLAYGMALAYGDLWYRLTSTKGRTAACVDTLFGKRFSAETRATIVKNHYRIRSCELVDMIRLQGDGRRLLSLVEVRGLENLRNALAGGKGAVVCSAHFTRNEVTAFSVIGALGFPISIIARWSNKSDFRQFHFSRPNIERRPGNLSIAVQATMALRSNEFVGVMIDHATKRGDNSRRVTFDFLDRKALLVPGASTIAQLSGSPLMVALIYRARDWRHQVLEISPPVAIQGNHVEAFRKCLGIVETTVMQNPAQWKKLSPTVLTTMGLLSRGSGAD